MPNPTRHQALLALPLIVTFVACGHDHVASVQMRQAQQTLARAQSGPAHTLAPEHVLAAQQTLVNAQRASLAKDNEAADALSYVAERKAETAEARAGVVLAQTAQREADIAYTPLHAEAVDRARHNAAMAHQQHEATERTHATIVGLLHGSRASKHVAVQNEKTQVRISVRDQSLFKPKSLAFASSARVTIDHLAKVLKACGSSDMAIVPAQRGLGSDALAKRRAQAFALQLSKRGIKKAEILSAQKAAALPGGMAAQTSLAVIIRSAYAHHTGF